MSRILHIFIYYPDGAPDGAEALKMALARAIDLERLFFKSAICGTKKTATKDKSGRNGICLLPELEVQIARKRNYSVLK